MMQDGNPPSPFGGLTNETKEIKMATTETWLEFNREDYSGDTVYASYRFRDLSEEPEFKAHLIDVECDGQTYIVTSCVEGWELNWNGIVIAKAEKQGLLWDAYGGGITREDVSPVIALLRVALYIIKFNLPPRRS